MLIDLRVKHDVGAWGHPVVLFDSGMGCWVVSCANSLRILIARTRHELYTREVFSCWTSRGGCSASRCSERHAGILRDRARGAVRARTGNAVAVWAASRIR